MLKGPDDDLREVEKCIDELRGDSQLIVRCYDSFQDADSRYGSHPANPRDYTRLTRPQCPIELVLQFRSKSGDVAGFVEFVRSKLREHQSLLYAVQITEEANFADGPDVIDGPYPEVKQALVEGVIAAKQTLRDLGAGQVEVGFNVTPTFGRT